LLAASKPNSPSHTAEVVGITAGGVAGVLVIVAVVVLYKWFQKRQLAERTRKSYLVV